MDPRTSTGSKRVVVTGGNNGIGFETAKGLYLDGHHVLIGSRNERKNQEAVQLIRDSGPSGGSIQAYTLDLAKRTSIESFAKHVATVFPVLDILVNNAGAVYYAGAIYNAGAVYNAGITVETGLILNELERSELGVEMTMAINHFGPFYLTYLLWPTLARAPEIRIVNVSSLAHRQSGGNVAQDLELRHSSYSSFGQYAKSKLANVLFTVGLAQRLAKHPQAKTVSLHPGAVDTGFGVDHCLVSCFKRMCCCCFRTQHDGAATSLHLCRTDFGSIRNGEYYDSDTQWAEMSSVARNPREVSELWEASEKLYAIKFDV